MAEHVVSEFVRDQLRQTRRIQHPDVHEDIALPVDRADVQIRGGLNRDPHAREAIKGRGAIGEALDLGHPVLLLGREAHAAS